jgi:predicted 3-demethylubiquinone-9 3-methyltransferase (glyoxalase superfamily)
MPAITPMLWFDKEAEEAARFYVSVFPNSKITATSRYGDAGPGPKGSVMTVAFELDGNPFTALNGGPLFKFNESVSFVIHCKDQAEVDRYWEKLVAGGGRHSDCGWLKDRYGLSWQVTPDMLLELITQPDDAKKQRVMKAMMQMQKLDIAVLRKAAEG